MGVVNGRVVALFLGLATVAVGFVPAASAQVLTRRETTVLDQYDNPMTVSSRDKPGVTRDAESRDKDVLAQYKKKPKAGLSNGELSDFDAMWKNMTASQRRAFLAKYAPVATPVAGTTGTGTGQTNEMMGGTSGYGYGYGNPALAQQGNTFMPSQLAARQNPYTAAGNAAAAAATYAAASNQNATSGTYTPYSTSNRRGTTSSTSSNSTRY